MDKELFFEKIAEMKFLTKHDIGQNFLIDSDAAKRIVDLLDLNEADFALEIGCGAGSLSYFLAESSAKVEVIDIDESMVSRVNESFSDHANIKAIKSNGLTHDLADYTKIVGNLPYYITTGLIEHVLLEAKKCRKAVFMVQKEALTRILAPKGEKEYGALQILLEYRAKIKREFKVPRTSFVPAPHVDSSVFTLDFNENDVEQGKKLFKLANALFLHRRKTIYNNLSTYLQNGEKAMGVLTDAGIKPTARPEQLSMAEYLKICDLIS